MCAHNHRWSSFNVTLQFFVCIKKDVLDHYYCTTYDHDGNGFGKLQKKSGALWHN